MQNCFSILLIPFAKTDIPELLGWLNDKDAEFLMQFAGPGYVYTLNEKQLSQTLWDKRCLAFKAVDQDTGNAAGHCQLMRIDQEKRKASVGRVFIHDKQRGKGLGYSMMKALMDYSFCELNLELLSLRVFDFNKPAYECYRKLGFIETNSEDIFFESLGKTWKCISMDYRI